MIVLESTTGEPLGPYRFKTQLHTGDHHVTPGRAGGPMPQTVATSDYVSDFARGWGEWDLHRAPARGPRTLFATHYQELTQLHSD